MSSMTDLSESDGVSRMDEDFELRQVVRFRPRKRNSLR